MDHSKIECNCVFKGDLYKAPEQHAPTCPVYLHMKEVMAGTCLDCRSAYESEGNP